MFFAIRPCENATICIYFAFIRARRPHKQVTHVFALANADLKASSTDENRSFIEFNPPLTTADDRQRFSFVTVWQLARNFLEDNAVKILIQTLPHKFRADLSADAAQPMCIRNSSSVSGEKHQRHQRQKRCSTSWTKRSQHRKRKA